MRFLISLTPGRLCKWVAALWLLSSPAFAETGDFPPVPWLPPMLTAVMVALTIALMIWMIIALFKGGRLPWLYAVMVSVAYGLFLYIRLQWW